MSPVELLGVIFGAASVWLTARHSLWCWPTGIANTALFIVLFAGARLYGDVVVNAIMLALCVYGWWQWQKGGPRGAPRRIAWATPRARTATVVALALLVPASGWGLERAGSALPWWEGAIVGLSLLAQLLLGRKLVESWILWIAVDLIAVGVYLSRGLFLTAALYAGFLVLATHGLVRWARLTASCERL
jgi:nicotinamide mononucleotide transporter